MHYIFENELEQIGNFNLQAALHMALFGIGFGSALTLWVTVFTVDFKPPFVFAGFLTTAIFSTIFTIYFGLRSGIDIRNSQKRIEAIKQGAGQIDSSVN